jgi:hypothetical protein
MYSLHSTRVLHLLAAERQAQLRRSARPFGCRRRGISGVERVGLALIRLGKWLAPTAERTLATAR